jgi:hypothetical protein
VKPCVLAHEPAPEDTAGAGASRGDDRSFGANTIASANQQGLVGEVLRRVSGPVRRTADQAEDGRVPRTPSANLRSTSRIVASLVGPRAIGSSLTITARTAPSV